MSLKGISVFYFLFSTTLTTFDNWTTVDHEHFLPSLVNPSCFQADGNQWCNASLCFSCSSQPFSWRRNDPLQWMICCQGVDVSLVNPWAFLTPRWKFCFGDWYDNMVVWFWRCCFVQFQCRASLVVRFSSLPKLETVEFGHSDPLDRSRPTRDDRFWLGVVPVLCAVLSSGLTAALTQRALKGAQGRKLGQTDAKPIGLGRLWCSTSSEPSYHVVVPERLVVRVQPPVHGWLGVSIRYI